MTGLLVASAIVITLVTGTLSTVYVFKRIWLEI